MKKHITENVKTIKSKKNIKIMEDNGTKSKFINNRLIKKTKKLNTDVEKTTINNRYSPLNTINQSIEIPSIGDTNIDNENYETKINNIIDNELDELKKDEENIELLLDQLNDINETDII